jgi:Uma2 family endonuclease
VNIAVPKARMDVAEFLAWSEGQPDDRYELVEGEVVAMTRDTVRHNQTKARIWRTLDDAVRKASLPCVVFVDGVGVASGKRTMRIPDVLVQCGPEPAPDAMVVDTPLIVVEVVSPSSEREDVESKLVDYFSMASVRHYLIVLLEKRVVLHHYRDNAGQIGVHILRDGELALDPPGLSVPVAALLGPEPAGSTEASQR